MKAKYHIVTLLGSLILFFIGHNILPHHHHLDDAYSHDGCEEHEQAGHQQEADDPSGHCHAFNGFEYVLSFENSFKPNPQKQANEFLASVNLCSKPDVVKVFAYRSVRPPIIPSGNFGSSPGLRGPPLA